ncbi:hypothetical protein AVEN_54671-1 [Araneus ventricosus]|uniref:Uncharacterized protein n=1 Tax=Araneus ventricosus TaxID=182803 RepID=A0A4Y2BPC7_ARAVE|nr:hypothetical protein AVEN_54671-1 [Araneus ventricosus]
MTWSLFRPARIRSELETNKNEIIEKIMENLISLKLKLSVDKYQAIAIRSAQNLNRKRKGQWMSLGFGFWTAGLVLVSIDPLLIRKANDIREEQLKDEYLKKITNCFENYAKPEYFGNWTSRGYLMSNGLLYSYSPGSEFEEAQLKSPTSYVITSLDKPSEPITTYHIFATYHTFRDMDTSPIAQLRKRGRPPKVTVAPRTTNQEPSGGSKATSKRKHLFQRIKKPQTTTRAPKSSSPVSLPGRLQSQRV